MQKNTIIEEADYVASKASQSILIKIDKDTKCTFSNLQNVINYSE